MKHFPEIRIDTFSVSKPIVIYQGSGADPGLFIGGRAVQHISAAGKNSKGKKCKMGVRRGGGWVPPLSLDPPQKAGTQTN